MWHSKHIQMFFSLPSDNCKQNRATNCVSCIEWAGSTCTHTEWVCCTDWLTVYWNTIQHSKFNIELNWNWLTYRTCTHRILTRFFILLSLLSTFDIYLGKFTYQVSNIEWNSVFSLLLNELKWKRKLENCGFSAEMCWKLYIYSQFRIRM